MRMTMIFHVFYMLLMLPLNLAAKTCCATNGCSIPGNLPYFYKSRFTPACNKHDVCYACGVKNGWSRRQCDVAFKRDMNRLCQSLGWQKHLCLVTANNYYLAVRTLGGSHYENPSLCWCDYCPTNNGNPSAPLGR